MKHFLYLILVSFSCYFSLSTSFAQTTVYGRVIDSETQEGVIGARVVMPGTVMGTITDLEGEFQLTADLPFPWNFQALSTGFEERTVAVTDSTAFVEITLAPSTLLGNSTVVSASRVEENLIESPVTISQQKFLDFRYHPDPDIYGSLVDLEGTMVNPSSYTFQSVNTRGFGNVQNWRFLQFVDGMDISGPGVNYAVGSMLHGSELDVRSIEVVPGAGSALYGPNALNGLLVTRTQNPFDHPGLSAYLRQGVMDQADGTQDPFYEVGFRYATSFDEKWAFKINMSYTDAQDWQANDPSYLITNADIPFQESLLGIPANDPNFNSVNRYGDEVVANVMLNDSSFLPVNRSGIAEEQVLNARVQNFYAQASVHYRINPKLEASYDFRYAKADAIIRYENFYPFNNFTAQYHKVELKGDRLQLRGYLAEDESGDAYSMLAAGAIVQEGLKPTEAWGADYGAAYRGEVPGINAGDHGAAREFADRDIDQNGVQALLDRSRSVPIDLEGGSAVQYRSRFVHGDVLVDLSEDVKYFNLQVGGSARRYLLDSRGHVYNDGPFGFAAPIPVVEYGAFVQLKKTLVNDHLTLQASARYDKNQAFEGRVTPRASAVWTLDQEKRFAIRASAQTGFRNPANQDTYVAFNAGPLIYLGNIQANVESFTYTANQNEEQISGTQIYQNLVTLPSFEAFMGGGGTDPSLLQPANLKFLEQEQITAGELGFRGLIGRNLFVDLHGYYNRYRNFTANVITVSPEAQKPFLLLTNIPDLVTSFGAGISIQAKLPAGYELGGNYTFMDFDAKDALAANPFYFPDFNTPNHMAKVSFGNRDVFEGLGFQLRYRWLDGYTFQSPNGQGQVPSYQVVDGAVTYRMSAVKCLLKLGATNLFGEVYTPVYGGPQIGSKFYFQITFDEWLEGGFKKR